MSPMTFDLMTPKSNQFIGLAWYLHLMEFDGNLSIGSNDVISSYFCIHKLPLALQDTYMTQVWQESINRFLR